MTGNLHHLSIVDLLLGGAVASMAVFLIGTVAHAVMKEHGFGTLVNGLLLVAGMTFGVFARGVTFGFQ